MGLVRVIDNDGHFHGELINAGAKLVVVDFTATWCGPCQRIAPIFEQLSTKYPNAIFLKVDVDKCAETAAGQGVSAMPTFIFYRNRTKLDTCQGADPAGLESKIQQLYGSVDGDDSEGSVAGHMDLNTFIMKAQCECLNESDDHNLSHCLTSNGGYLESDCDEQLIISITFSQTVKVHSLKIKAPVDKGPKNLKLFINQPRTIDFDLADSNTSVQNLTLSAKDIEDGTPVQLRYVKFQNVHNLQIFVKDNQNDCETTQIDHLSIIGSPVSTTNMENFKRVAGEKGAVFRQMTTQGDSGLLQSENYSNQILQHPLTLAEISSEPGQHQTTSSINKGTTSGSFTTFVEIPEQSLHSSQYNMIIPGKTFY